MTKKKEEQKIVSIFDAYGTDPEKAVNGVWRELPYLPGAEVLVARIGNKEFQNKLTALRKPYTKGMRPGHELPQEVQDQTLVKAIVDTILLGWRGIYAPNDKGEVVEIPYTKENAMKLLLDPRLIDFRDGIVALSNDFEMFKIKADEDGAENLKK